MGWGQNYLAMACSEGRGVSKDEVGAARLRSCHQEFQATHFRLCINQT